MKSYIKGKIRVDVKKVGDVVLMDCFYDGTLMAQVEYSEKIRKSLVNILMEV